MYLVRFTVLIFVLLLSVGLHVSGQSGDIVSERLVFEKDTQRGLPGQEFIYKIDEVVYKGIPGPLSFREIRTIPFTGLAVGWEASDKSIDPHTFHFHIRSREGDGEWTQWHHIKGYDGPFDTPSGLYWSQLYITEYGYAHDEFDIRFDAPDDVTIDFVRIDIADARSEQTTDRTAGPRSFNEIQTSKPEIITREEWWGNLPADRLAWTTDPTPITITHAIVHHTAGQNNPPDPAQTVRNIWNFHVNSRGWADIGYNFLVDQFGNIYQGRYNPWLDQTDVHGAHAGNANSRSVGISILGQFHPPEPNPPSAHPDERSLRSVESIIAWRFYQRELDPFEEAAIPSAWGTITIPRISGHRDVSATACPGDNLYVRLPEIRQNVFLLLDFDIFFVGAPGTAPQGSDPDFATLKAAIDSVNAHEFTQDVMIYITSDLTEDEDIALGVNTNGYTLTIKPYLDVQATIEFTNAEGGVGGQDDRPFIPDHFIIGASQPDENFLTATHNVTIDGSNEREGTSRDLTIIGAETGEVKSLIRVIGNSDNVQIKNVNIESRATITQIGQAAVHVTNFNYDGAALKPDNIGIQNNKIVSAGSDGIFFWHLGAPDEGIENARILSNEITAPRRGINALRLDELIVRGNTFTIPAGTSDAKGIYLGFAVEGSDGSIEISGNEFVSLASSTGTGLMAIDIQLANSSTVTIYNNLISGFRLEPEATDIKLYGIRHAAMGDVTTFIYYNTILIPALQELTNFGDTHIAAFAFERADGTAPLGTAHLKNNIFYIDESVMPVYGMIRVGSEGALFSDVNNIFVRPDNGNIGFYDDTAVISLEDWQTASGGDTLSVSVPVEFTSGDNPRLTGSSVGDWSIAADPIDWITHDIDGNPRRDEFPLRPYKGGHEPAIPIVLLQTIAEARERPSGSMVSVAGIVTRARGSQVAIQDGTAGLVIRQSSGDFYNAVAVGSVKMGDELWVQGVITTLNQQTRIAPGDLDLFGILSRNNPVPEPVELSLEQFITEGSQHQGKLIRVNNIVVNDRGHDTFRSGNLYPLTDASGETGAVTLAIGSASDTELVGDDIPQEPVTITGTLMQFHGSDPNAGFRIMPILESDIDMYVGIDEEESHPVAYALFQNYPNPFNPSTTIRYAIPEQQQVSIRIYNSLGQLATTLLNNELQAPGRYEITWDGTDSAGLTVASGLYIYRITAGEFVDTKRMMYIK